MHLRSSCRLALVGAFSLLACHSSTPVGQGDGGSSSSSGSASGSSSSGGQGASCASVVCPASAICVQGQCLPTSCGQAACPPGDVCVNGVGCTSVTCVGLACPAGQSCAGGACYPTSCGGTPCDGGVCVGGACANAACVGVTCPSGQYCAQGSCQTSCPHGCPTGYVCLTDHCGLVQCVKDSDCPDALVCQFGNCGAPCSPACGGGESCVDGNCLPLGAPDAGSCLVDDAGFLAGQMEPGNPCATCQPAVSESSFTALADGANCGSGWLCAAGVCTLPCTIPSSGAGQTISPGAVNPANACQSCQPSVSTGSYSPVVDGTGCGAGTVCRGGACVAGCGIAGSVFDAGAPDFGNPCRTCQPASSTIAFSALPDGTPCGAGGAICVAGGCAAACLIGNATFAAGASNPANACQSCQPGTSATAWTTLADGSACGSGATCAAGSCECGAGLSFCGIDCVDPSLNSANCGSCGKACGTAAISDGGLEATACFGGACGEPAQLPFARAGLGAALGSDGRIYAVGGATAMFGRCTDVTGECLAGNALTTEVDAYDVKTNAWSKVAPLPAPRYLLGVVAGLDGRVYAIGGAAAWTNWASGPLLGAASNEVDIYDPQTDSWTSGPPLPTARAGLGVAVGPDGRIWALGGTSGNGNPLNHLTTVEAYDPDAGQWTEEPPMQTSRYFLSAGFGSDGLLYAVAGNQDCTTAEVLLPDAGPDGGAAWQAAASLPQSGCFAAETAGPDGRLYLLGGGAENSSYIDRIENSGGVDVLSFVGGGASWSNQPSLVTPRAMAAAAFGPDGRLYVLGGLDLSVQSPFPLLAKVEVFDPATEVWAPGLSTCPLPGQCAPPCSAGSCPTGQSCNAATGLCACNGDAGLAPDGVYGCVNWMGGYAASVPNVDCQCQCTDQADNPYTGLDSCPAGLTPLALQSQTDCAQAPPSAGCGGSVGVVFYFCQGGYLPGAAWQGAYRGTEGALADAGNCQTPNPYTDSCACPAGTTDLPLDVQYNGDHLCFNTAATLQNQGGAYEQTDSPCTGPTTCEIPNPFTGACGCPAGFSTDPMRVETGSCGGAWLQICYR